jgi:hypothetical protein
MATEDNSRADVTEAFRAGRRVGFGISALSLALISFLSLLGTEKAILAMVLGGLAIRGSGRGTQARRLGTAAICIGGAFIATLIVGVIVFWSRFMEFIEMLNGLS